MNSGGDSCCSKASPCGIGEVTKNFAFYWWYNELYLYLYFYIICICIFIVFVHVVLLYCMWYRICEQNFSFVLFFCDTMNCIYIFIGIMYFFVLFVFLLYCMWYRRGEKKNRIWFFYLWYNELYCICICNSYFYFYLYFYFYCIVCGIGEVKKLLHLIFDCWCNQICCRHIFLK